MKILCLHGNGTNSNIMQLQTASLRHELDDGHSYEFVEAAVQAPMSEGVEALSLPTGSFYYAFYNPEDLGLSLRRSVDQLFEYVLAEGPFDAIMGFSGGAFLAAVYLKEQQQRKDHGKIEIDDFKSGLKCGIFISSAYCKAGESKGGVSVLGKGATITVPGGASEEGETSIKIPTAHIWGSNDSVDPTGGEHVSQMCDPNQRLIFIHDGGHEPPRGDYLVKAVQIIRRTIDLAEPIDK